MTSKAGQDYDEDVPRPDFSREEDPIALFGRWLKEAGEKEPNDPEAMALATVDEHGMPNIRMVLLKGHDQDGFVFYTNLNSAKGRELAANPRAALNFHWKSLHRQVRIRGLAEQISDSEADCYFASRPRGSRIGAWASKQSQPLESRFALEKRVAKYTARYGVGEVPRPSWWSGFRIRPLEIEFWHDRRFRLHDRILFHRPGPEHEWSRTRLYP